MEKVIIGIDVAKDTLEVALLQNGQWLVRSKLPNTAAGHNTLLELAQPYEHVHVVLEATGSYHACLVRALVKAELLLSVVNPLVIRRFAQMKLRRLKTDRSDAMLIAQYGLEQNPRLYQLPAQVVEQLAQLQSQVRLFTRQRTALLNQQHAHQYLASPMSVCTRITKQAISQLSKHLAKLEAEQERLIDTAFASERALLESIAGIGPKTSRAILAALGDMSQFENHKQVAAYVGINPVPRQSGTSLRPRAHISKQGHAGLRTLLYLAALSAKVHNPACRDLYERLRAKGKPAKVALMAVANKLVKQVFAIIKSGVPYDPNYQAKLAIM